MSQNENPQKGTDPLPPGAVLPAATCSASDIPEGQINLDDDSAKIIGFTSDRFDGYLWRSGAAIIISFIASRARGNFRALVERIVELGLRVDVPTPLGRMESIVVRNGYRHRIEEDPMMGPVEVWSWPNVPVSDGGGR